MTPKQINAKIAEIIGWKPKLWRCDNPDCDDCARGASHEEDPPDFYRSLDACRLFEKSFSKGNIEDPGHPRYRYAYLLYDDTIPDKIQPCLAPAKYRAMAFLKLAQILSKEELKQFKVR